MAVPPRSVIGSPVGQNLSELHLNDDGLTSPTPMAARNSSGTGDGSTTDAPSPPVVVVVDNPQYSSFFASGTPHLETAATSAHQLLELSDLAFCSDPDGPKGEINEIKVSSWNSPDHGRIQQYEMFSVPSNESGSSFEDTVAAMPEPESFLSACQASGDQRDF